MKKTYFRIIELEKYQVLLIKTENDDDDPAVSFQFRVGEGIEVTTKFGFNTEEARDVCFDGFTDEMAQELIDGVIEDYNLG